MKFKRFILFCAGLVFASLHLSVQADHLSPMLSFSARLNGANEVPPISVSGLGVASFLLNPTMDSLCVSVSTTGLTGPITGMHIHEGAAGTTGGVVIDLSSDISGSRATAKIAITSMDLQKMIKGLYYLNVHTAANPSGEIRGQVTLEKDFSYRSVLDQAYVSSGSMATGLGTYVLSLDKRWLDINVVINGLSGPIVAAHFHDVATGNVVAGLDSLIMGNRIKGRLTGSAIDPNLLNGGYYLNVHTAMHPMGEVAALVETQSGTLTFDVAMNNALLGTSATAEGNAHFMLSSSMDTLWYVVSWDTLSSTQSGIHIHHSSGSVVHNMGPNVTGNWAMGMWVNPPDSVLIDMLEGNAYVNLHTTMNPSGEISGRILRHAREGYPVNMDPSQTVPFVSSGAMGGGIVTVNRSQTNAHYMLVVEGLSGPMTAAHFHKGIMGETGGVLYTLPFVNNAAYGYWSDSSVTPFVTANSLQFRRDSIYVNVHTSANPPGELRGQATRNGECFEVQVGVNDPIAPLSGRLTAFPNPAQESMNLVWEGDETPDQVELLDLTGRTWVKETWSNQQLDVRSLPAGIYLLRVLRDGAATQAIRVSIIR